MDEDFPLEHLQPVGQLLPAGLEERLGRPADLGNGGIGQSGDEPIQGGRGFSESSSPDQLLSQRQGTALQRRGAAVEKRQEHVGGSGRGGIRRDCGDVAAAVGIFPCIEGMDGADEPFPVRQRRLAGYLSQQHPVVRDRPRSHGGQPCAERTGLAPERRLRMEPVQLGNQGRQLQAAAKQGDGLRVPCLSGLYGRGPDVLGAGPQLQLLDSRADQLPADCVPACRDPSQVEGLAVGAVFDQLVDTCAVGCGQLLLCRISRLLADQVLGQSDGFTHLALGQQPGDLGFHGGSGLPGNLLRIRAHHLEGGPDVRLAGGAAPRGASLARPRAGLRIAPLDSPDTVSALPVILLSAHSDPLLAGTVPDPPRSSRTHCFSWLTAGPLLRTSCTRPAPRAARSGCGGRSRAARCMP